MQQGHIFRHLSFHYRKRVYVDVHPFSVVKILNRQGIGYKLRNPLPILLIIEGRSIAFGKILLYLHRGDTASVPICTKLIKLWLYRIQKASANTTAS